MMTQEELGAMPEVTPEVIPEARVIDGRHVVVPVQRGWAGVLYRGHEDAMVVGCARTGNVYEVGWLNGVRVKRISNTWT